MIFACQLTFFGLKLTPLQNSRKRMGGMIDEKTAG